MFHAVYCQDRCSRGQFGGKFGSKSTYLMLNQSSWRVSSHDLLKHNDQYLCWYMRLLTCSGLAFIRSQWFKTTVLYISFQMFYRVFSYSSYWIKNDSFQPFCSWIAWKKWNWGYVKLEKKSHCQTKMIINAGNYDNAYMYIHQGPARILPESNN